MCTPLHRISYTVYLQFIQVLNIFALKPWDIWEVVQHKKSAPWPLQVGYPGLSIQNLNEYVSLFSHCLVNIQNYQGIEILGIKSPVYITRFDVANLDVCVAPLYSHHTNKTHRFFFGKIPSQSERNCKTNYTQAIKYTDKSFNARWTCTAQFDLFFPEPLEAPHIILQSQRSGIHFSPTRGTRTPENKNLFDINLEYISALEEYREDWSKIQFNY